MQEEENGIHVLAERLSPTQFPGLLPSLPGFPEISYTPTLCSPLLTGFRARSRDQERNRLQTGSPRPCLASGWKGGPPASISRQESSTRRSLPLSSNCPIYLNFRSEHALDSSLRPHYKREKISLSLIKEKNSILTVKKNFPRHLLQNGQTDFI